MVGLVGSRCVRGCVIASNIAEVQFHNPPRCTAKPALREMLLLREEGWGGGG